MLYPYTLLHFTSWRGLFSEQDSFFGLCSFHCFLLFWFRRLSRIAVSFWAQTCRPKDAVSHRTETIDTAFERRNFRVFVFCQVVQRHWSGEMGKQEDQLSPRDRAMRRVNWNLANWHATVQKLLMRQVLTKSMVWSWRFSRRQCLIDNVHSTMTRPSRFPLSQPLRCHKETDDGRVVYTTCIPTTSCGEIF